ncbi:restriction endonuclease subunit S [Dermabacter sp. HSID17554]|uniref:restriction endonuclease subunit S n=1 Tax=Dermabacter sp. HSID17554 TaxID=2419511 RepID=UPI00138746A2|nr:restriction endonuclease subunit S [Dermabacter sp. HSID17554]
MKTDIPYGALEECRFPLVPLGAIAHFTSGWTPSSKNSAFYSGVNKWATIADLNSHYISDTRQRISDVAVREAGHPKLSNPGDLLFSFKLSVGMTSIVSSPMYTNEAIATFRPSRYLDAGFAYYAFPVFLSAAARPNIYGAPLLSASLISRARVPRLSLMDQRRIADYLDEEVREMDALVVELDNLVDDLVTRRARLIEKHVAQYVSEASRERGGYPKHSLKFLISDHFAGEWGVEAGQNEVDVTCVRVADFNRGTSSVSKNIPTTRSYSTKVLKQKCLSSGDLLLEKSGGGAKTPVGSVVLYRGSGAAMCANFIEVLRLKNGQSNRFWAYVLRSSFVRGNTVPCIKQTTGIQNLDIQLFFDQKFVVPPDKKQREIADELDRETAEMDSLIKEATELIENLKARKTALITEVVTGRKKV